MTESQVIHQISRCFSRLRQQTNMSQNTLAKSIGIDQGKLSRIESGEYYSKVDTEKYLNALGTPDASKFKTFLSSNWVHTDIPDFWNPQYDCLVYAEYVLSEINNFLQQHECPAPLKRYLQQSREQLLEAAKYLCSQKHNISFIGSIGIGKSTAISFLFGLLNDKDVVNEELNRPILETGSGGTTICEVKIIDSEDYGLHIVPYSTDEFNNIISDFCKILWNRFRENASKTKYESITQSREIDRAIRNMSCLTTQRIPNGNSRIRHDPAQDLIMECSSEDEFKVKVLNRINLQKRTNNTLVFDKNPSVNPKKWLSDVFKDINNGRVEDMPMPQKITLMIPNFNTIFANNSTTNYDITVVDTKGIDDVIVRADLDDQIKDKRTIVVFCSGFNDASGKPTKEILEHIKNDIGISPSHGKFALLVLPRTGEAIQAKDDLGNMANDAQEGYEIKNDQITDAIAENIPIYFYNVLSDTPSDIIANINKQISDFRNAYADVIEELGLTVEYYIKNSKEATYIYALEEVARRIEIFLQGNRTFITRKKYISSDVRRIFSDAHPSTLWATTRRSGVYGNLNICHVISNAAKSDANERFSEWFSIFKGEINALNADKNLEQAHQFITNIEKYTHDLKNKFLNTVADCGEEVYSNKITTSPVWLKCVGEWGQGAGFKNRVLRHIDQWFEENQNLQSRLDTLIDKFWDEIVISGINAMLDSKKSDSGNRQ